MRRIRIRVRLKIYPVLWSIIIILSVYILIRFAILTFSEDMGQAGFGEALISKLCTSIMESGSSLVSYTSNDEGDAYAFPLSIMDENLVLEEFAGEDSINTARAQEEANIFNEISTESLAITNNEADAGSEEAVYNEEAFDSEKAVGSEEKVISKEAKLGTLGVYEIESNIIGLEYILTNGEVLCSNTTGILLGNESLISGQLQIGYLDGNISQKDIIKETTSEEETVETVTTGETIEYTLDQLKDSSFLIRNFYFVDASTTISETLFDAEELIGKDMTLKQGNDAPQILIYHTHAQEAFADSRAGETEDTVVGVGNYLTEILKEDYGYNVIHDTTTYCVPNYKLSYNQAEIGITKILEENPTIEVIIDLHRNSGKAKYTMINGKETAQIMLFNGLCRDQNGPITSLDNPYLQDNLAFSFQLQLKSLERYPGLFNKNYLKSYRFNMHFRPKCMLMELGSVNNTLESAKNAMVPFAEILDQLLKGK